jgi:serine/threonine protein kinase
MGDEPIGEVLARRYRIIETIGQGGMGTVYKALDTRLKRLVALKVNRFALDAESRQRFLREANSTARLNHPNILQIYDHGEADGLPYLAFEYVEGRSLQQIMAEAQPVETDYAIEIIRQVGMALGYAHQHGVIHRDVKPSNILISNDGRVLLLDFGLAIPPGAPTLTETGTLVGTPAYMSPEQAMGRPVDARSDLFSLGVVFYELLAGCASAYEISRNIVEQAPAPLRLFDSRLPISVEQIVLKSLAKDPDQRLQTANEFLSALDEATPGPHPQHASPIVQRSGSEISAPEGARPVARTAGVGEEASLLDQIVEAGRFRAADSGQTQTPSKELFSQVVGHAFRDAPVSPAELAEARSRLESALRAVPPEQAEIRGRLEALLRQLDLRGQRSTNWQREQSATREELESGVVQPTAAAPLRLERASRLRWQAPILIGLAVLVALGAVIEVRTLRPVLAALGAALALWLLWRSYAPRFGRRQAKDKLSLNASRSPFPQLGLGVSQQPDRAKPGGLQQTVGQDAEPDRNITDAGLMPYTPATEALKRYPSAIAWLLVLDGQGHGREFRLADNVTIGRQADNDIVFRDNRISRRHARISLENGRFYISDLETRHGTFVNGVPVHKHELQDRDEITLGVGCQLLFIQAVGPADLTIEARRRLREFDSVWDQLTTSARHD